MSGLDSLDRKIVGALAKGLPLAARPYATAAEALGLEEQELLGRLCRMAETGALRRVAAVPNHYRLGWQANGMSVWDVDDAAIDELGPQVGALDFVTHCYRRPRRLPDWPYNLFAMLHGQDRAEVARQAEIVARLLGSASRARDVLYSTRILKKTGLRLAA